MDSDWLYLFQGIGAGKLEEEGEDSQAAGGRGEMTPQSLNSHLIPAIIYPVEGRSFRG